MRKIKLSEIRQMRKQILSNMASENSFSPNHKLHLKHSFSFKRVKFIEKENKIQMIYKTGSKKIYKAGIRK